VRAQLSTIQSDEVTPDRRFRARVDDAIREGLKALGYYEPTIDFDLRPPPKKGRQVLIARVSAGSRYGLAARTSSCAAGRVPTGITWICSARGRRSAPCLTMAITTISKKS
jgi:outer membrane translocation and assembly module TamA